MAAASALVFAALPALAQKPQIQWNDEYDFDSVQTFMWQSIEEAQMAAANPFMHSLIKNLLAAEFATSGLTEVTSNPDVYVTYYGSTETEVQLRTDSYGYSYGGYAALAGAAFTPELYRCAVSIAGVSDLAEQVQFVVREGEREEADYIRRSIGDPRTDRARIDARSPALHAANIRIPVLLLHGSADSVVPVDQ